jgi:hypothetical protein
MDPSQHWLMLIEPIKLTNTLIAFRYEQCDQSPWMSLKMISDSISDGTQKALGGNWRKLNHHVIFVDLYKSP